MKSAANARFVHSLIAALLVAGCGGGGDDDMLRTALDLLAASLADTIGSVGTLLAEQDRVSPVGAERRLTGTTDAPVAETRAAVRELAKLLRDSDAEATEYAEENEAKLETVLGGMFARFTDAISDYDFSVALGILEERAREAGIELS